MYQYRSINANNNENRKTAERNGNFTGLLTSIVRSRFDKNKYNSSISYEEVTL